MNLFRPSDVCIGPDGAIYVADWFDARVGGHGTRDNGQTGAIYRIAPKNSKLSIPDFDLSSTSGQIEALKNPLPMFVNRVVLDWQKQERNLFPQFENCLMPQTPSFKARAIWLLAKLGSEGLKIVENKVDHKTR